MNSQLLSTLPLCPEQSMYRTVQWKKHLVPLANKCLNQKQYPLYVSVQSLSRVQLFATPWIAARQASLSITNSQSSLRLTSIESVMPSNHLILCRSLLFLPSIHPSPCPCMYVCIYMWTESCSVVSNSLQPHGLYSHWHSSGQDTGVDSLSLLQGILPTQGSNPGLQHCRRTLYQLSHKVSPRILEWVAYPFSSGSSRPRNRTGVSCIADGSFTNWAIREEKRNITQPFKRMKCCHLQQHDRPRDHHTEWSKSGRERQILYHITYIWNLKNESYKSIYLQNRNKTHGHRKQAYSYQKERGRGGIN